MSLPTRADARRVTTFNVDGATPVPPRRGRGHGGWLAAIPFVVLAAFVVVWWSDRPGAVPGALLLAIGQLTGLATSVFALATVALMARVPFVTNVVGSDRGLRWHRWSAIATMILLPVHIVTTTFAYVAADNTALGSEVAKLITTYPDMLTATVAAVLFGVVMTSSWRWLRRRFAYQTWLFVHWYSYLAVALAFGHTLSDGATFAGASGPTIVWTWLHLFVAGLVLWYRVVLPLWRMQRHPLTVNKVTREGPDAVSITLAGDGLDDYEAEAGQHVRVRFLTPGGRWQSHPFSLSAVPTRSKWRITVAAHGDYTRDLQSIPRGTGARVSGVYGDVTPSARTSDRVALIAGGAGITPLCGMLEAFPPQVDVRLVYRAHDWDDVILKRELDRFAEAHGGRVEYLVGPRNPDPTLDVLAPAYLAHLVPDLATRDVFVAGSAGFVDTVRASLQSLGVPRAHIHTERFDF